MLEKILVCTDGSEPAAQAVRLAAHLARVGGSELELVNVLDPVLAAGPYASISDAAPPTETLILYLEDAQNEILRQAEALIASAGIRCKVLAGCGNPVEQIVDSARRDGVELIVMSSRGRSPWEALLLGSVSDGVVHHAHIPVLVTRGEPARIERIVAASDGSECAEHALRAAVELARACQATVTIVFVAPYPPHSTDAAIRMRDAVRRQVERVCEPLGMNVELREEHGHPAEIIATFADREKADLIALGSRGLGGFRRLLLGSVSDAVLHHARCSVLIVR